MHHPLPKGLRVKSLPVTPLTMLCMLISSLAVADPHSFDIAPQPLAGALNRLAAQSGLQVIFDGTLVLGKHSPGVVGSKEPEAALAELLQGSGLTWRATGGNSVMLEKASESSGPLQLGATAIVGQELGEMTENTGSYTTGAMQTATKLPLTLRETPQSVSVVTRKRMDDKAMTSISDVAKSAPGIFLNNSGGAGRPTFSARGFDIDNIMYDGFPTSFLTYLPSGQANLAMYDRVEIVRGASGLAQGVATLLAPSTWCASARPINSRPRSPAVPAVGMITPAPWMSAAHSMKTAHCAPVPWSRGKTPKASETRWRVMPICSMGWSTPT